MPVLRLHRQTAPIPSPTTTPLNVANNWYTVTVPVEFDCNNQVCQFILDPTLSIGPGRWVLVKAGSITRYVGATVTASGTGRTVTNVTKESVVYSGVAWQCIVVTLT
jgi:hypothetical protein